MSEVMKDFRRPQQCLCWNATPIEADAAEMLTLDDSGFEAKLGRADRRNVAAWPAANDENVIGLRHWRLSLEGGGDGLSRQHPCRRLDQILERREKLRAQN